VAQAIGVEVTELGQSDWVTALMRDGVSQSYAQLVAELFVAHNAGRIDVQAGVTDVRHGQTELRDVIAQISSKVADQGVEPVA
jgi:hypothetical protein